MKREPNTQEISRCKLPLREHCRAAIQLDGEGYPAPGTQYIAPWENLTNLAGKAMRRRRTLINRFMAEEPGWSFREITHENIDAAFEVERRWQREEAGGEAAFVRLCFRNFGRLELMGGILTIGEAALGYSIAAPCGDDGALLLVLRAKPTPAGLSAMVYRQTALLLKQKLPALTMVNLGCCGGAAETQNRLVYRPRQVEAI